LDLASGYGLDLGHHVAELAIVHFPVCNFTPLSRVPSPAFS
jgi:hypothetical protein